MKKLIAMLVVVVLLLTALVLGGGNEAYGSGNNEAYGSLEIAYSNFTDSTAPAQMGALGRRRYRNVPFTTVELFDDATDWADVNGTDADNTTETVASDNDIPSSVKVTMAGGDDETLTTKTGGGYGSLRNSHMIVRFYVHAGTGTADPSQIDVIAIRLSDAGFANFMSVNVYTDGGIENYGGWQQLVVSLDNIPMNGGDVRETLYDNFDTIRCVVKTTGNSDATCSVTFDLIGIFPDMPQPKYLFTFDDGRDTDYALASYLHSKGLRGTFYVIGSLIGTTNYLTLDQLHRMQDAGHLIANHGWTSFNWRSDETSDENIRRELTRTAELLCANGFSRGSRIFALPNGTVALPQGSWDKYFKYWDNIRVTGDSVSLFPGFLDTGRISTSSFDNTTAAETALGLAVTGNTVVVTGWHSTNIPGSYTLANWKTHVDNVLAQQQAGNIDVVTVDELVYQADEYTYGYALENSIQLLSSTAAVDLDAANDTEALLFVVPPNKSAIVTHIVIHTLSANASAAVVTFGELGGACDEYLGDQTLSNLDGTSKYAVLTPVPNATPVAGVILDAGDQFGIEITTKASSACTATIDVFGYLQ